MLELTQIYGSWIALESLLLLALWLRGNGEPVVVPATTGAAVHRERRTGMSGREGRRL